LTPKDLEYAATIDNEMSEKLKSIKTDLYERGSLTYKQLQYAGSMLHKLSK